MRHLSTTVNKKGCREVRIRSTGAEKCRFTVILACTAAGDMLPLLFKGKRALKTLRIPAGVVVRVQPKGWNDAELTKVWVQHVLYRYTKKKHALLVWDTLSGHMTEDVSEDLQKKNITVAVIPGGWPPKFNHLMCPLINPSKALVVPSGCITCNNVFLSKQKESASGQHQSSKCLTGLCNLAKT